MKQLQDHFNIDFNTIDDKIKEVNEGIDEDIKEFNTAKEKLQEIRHKNAELTKKLYTSAGNVRKTLSEEEVEDLKDTISDNYDDIHKLQETVDFYRYRQHYLHKKLT